MQSAISSNDKGGQDVFSSYSTEVSLAAQPDQLADRLNLLLLAGEMDTPLRSQVLSAIGSIAIPSSNQLAIDAALALRVRVAVYLIMASPAYAAGI
jgi:hypothetical protein